MRILVISTSVFPLPLSGYGGLEQLVYQWSVEFAKAGHKVSVVAPEGSAFPEELGIELIPVPLRCGEDVMYGIYKDRLMASQWDAVFDNSWTWMSVLTQMEADRQLPIIHCYHSDPYNLGAPPPIANPCIVAFSEAQANVIRSRWNVAVRVQHHGVDLDFYKPDPSVQRSNRYLFLARYTPEKGFLEIANIAKKCRVPLDAFGDMEIIASEDYMRKCFEENDGRQIKVAPGISRHETVKQYQGHKALITWPNYMEIFGLTTVECMATGTPVLSKDSGAARELIKQGKTGFVVSTLEELEDLIKSDAVSMLKPEDCRAQAEKFSIQKSAQGHLRCLQDVANGVWW